MCYFVLLCFLFVFLLLVLTGIYQVGVCFFFLRHLSKLRFCMNFNRRPLWWIINSVGIHQPRLGFRDGPMVFLHVFALD